METILIAFSSGLIGSEAVTLFDCQDHPLIGWAHNMCRFLSGRQGDSTSNLERLKRAKKDFFQDARDTGDRP
jgi:hypothetical protein